MLAKKYRLTKQEDFKRVNSLGRSFFSALFRIRVVKNSLEITRLAAVTPGRLSKKATVRNRVRRQINEILRLSYKNLFPGNDIVVWPKAGALGKNYKELEKDLLYLLSKARALKK